jgi:hypothetical protein
MSKKIGSILKKIILFSILIWVPIVSACSTSQDDLPLERVSLSKHACVDGGILTPHLPLGVNEQIKAPVLAGGTIRSGDFLISLSLICDPSLASDNTEFPEYSWQEYSEVRYLGLASGWEILGYHPELEGKEIRESLKINGEVIRGSKIGPEMSMSWGIEHGHYSSINTENQIVARALASEEPIDIVLTISSAEPLAAVHLRATFTEAPDGYRLLKAEIMEKQ